MRFAAMLDLGCGTGLAGAAFRAEVGHLTGIDLSAAMIAQAERPLLLAGGGVIRAQAAEALRAAVEKLQIPAATTTTG